MSNAEVESQMEWFGLFMSLWFHSSDPIDWETFDACSNDTPVASPTRVRYSYNRGWREMRD